MADQRLRELGEKLEAPPESAEELAEILQQTATNLAVIDQSPLPSVLDSLKKVFHAFSNENLLKTEDENVKVLIATSVCEITRITAPEAPYTDEVLRDIFVLIVGTFAGLNDRNSPTYEKRVNIIDMLARYRSCVVMLDLDCNDLINDMFHTFFTVVSDEHSENVIEAMQTIMVVIIEESEEIQENILLTILSALGKNKPGYSKTARKLAQTVISSCVDKLETSIKQFLESSISGEGAFSENNVDHYDVVFDLYQCGPAILTGIVPYITSELLTDKLEVRGKAVELIGDIISLPNVPILDSFKPVFAEFLKRLTDRNADLRISVINHLKNCLISNPTRTESAQIIQALCDRLLDYDENVRKNVVSAICDLALHSLDNFSTETVKLVAERLRDTSISVKKYTMERLSDVYRLYCEKYSDDSENADDFEWIPGKMLKCLYDKDFRPETIELTMIDSLFPVEFSVKDRAKHWVMFFSGFDKIETKALEQILLQKQRLQQEMQKYLSLRQTPQEEASDLQKRITACFRNMSRLFNEPAKSEENLNELNQLKDENIWKMLNILLDPATSFQQAKSSRDELLKILEEKHPLYEFMSMLSTRISFLLTNKEFVKGFFAEASEQKSKGDLKLVSSSMNLLTVIASFFPMLLAGSEEAIVGLLKEDNEILKEGIAHVLAKSGGTIRETLVNSSSSIDLLLERLCLEGSRKQAKYSVHALAAITKDDGLKSLSVLYKKLVDMLEAKVHLPSALQSLGCIAQIAMPIFETREEEILGFINSKILESANKAEENSPSKSEWGEKTESCKLKIYGIKTLVKSYLPTKDAHARKGIEKFLGILKNILSFGDVSSDINSSAIDKAHLRLASAKAILRLSRQWDSQIPADIFYLTLRISQDEHPESRKLFLGKVHQYIKERVLDAKYACAILLSISSYHTPEFEESKRDLLEVIQICQQVKTRQLSVQADTNIHTSYPEYILVYLIHALSHDPSCPEFDDGTALDAFGPTYWRLYLFLSVLLIGELKSQAGSAINKESFTTVISILKSIKSSQDLIDANKTQSLHAISDLALVIAKRLVPEEMEISSATEPVPLPEKLYVIVEKKEEENGEKKEEENGVEEDYTWSRAESVVLHFEALKVEEKESVDEENESLIPVTDGDGNELPLGQMLKIIKAQGSKKKKSSKGNSKPKENEKSKEKETPKEKEKEKVKDPFEFDDDDDDILGVVRDINSSKKDPKKDSKKESKKREIEKSGNSSNSGGIIAPTPKKKRSVAIQRTPQKKSEEKNKSEEKTPKFVKNDKEKEKEIKSGKEKDTKSTASKEKTPIVEESSKKSENKDTNGSLNKRKRESLPSLEKCSTKNDENELEEEELVGCKIKVWWPLDKKYYEGSVKSYDSTKKKHKVKYDDGDVEILNLAKEKWKLISTPAKKAKIEKTPNKSILAEKKAGYSSSQQKNSAKKTPISSSSTGRPRGRPRKNPPPPESESDDEDVKMEDPPKSDSEKEEDKEENKSAEEEDKNIDEMEVEGAASSEEKEDKNPEEELKEEEKAASSGAKSEEADKKSESDKEDEPESASKEDEAKSE